MPTPSADLAVCRALLRGGSRSFHAASRLLPARVRDPATALFAFCRVADDAIDLAGERVASLQARLALLYDGHPADHPADRALAHVVAAHRIPRALPEALLEGFAWDVAGRRYATLADLHAYAARVAGSVGAMMAIIMGARDAGALARACDLGVAMQLSNIARDVGEDARAGRLYLPLDWLAEAGVDPAGFVSAPAFTPALGAVVHRVLVEADRLYAQADAGIARLPWDCRPGIKAARLLYAAIGHRVGWAGGDSVSARAVVPPLAKCALLPRAAFAAVMPAARSGAPPLPATAFLVEASRPLRPVREVSRIAWTIDLFMRLEERIVVRPGGAAPWTPARD